MNPPEKSTGEWKEERLLLWREIELLQAEQARQKEKAREQIGASFTKIRDLESYKWKTWAASGAAAFLSLVVVELLKLLFSRK